MAAIVSLTTRRLDQLSKEGMPKSGRMGYPLAASVQWIIEYWRKRAVQSPLSSARRRKVEAEAEIAELELSRRRGELAEVDLIFQEYGAACARLRTRLLAIPSKLAPHVWRVTSAAEAAELLRREIVEALEELASVGANGSGSAGRNATADPGRAKRRGRAESPASKEAVA